MFEHLSACVVPDRFIVGVIAGAIGMAILLLAVDWFETARSYQLLWPSGEPERVPPAAAGLARDRRRS